jgi:hypothetical protein
MEALNKPGLGRREFIGAAAAALFAGVVVQIVGCDDSTSSGGDLPAGAVAAQVSTVNGHTHSGYITKAMLDANADAVITVSGAGHSHDVNLTAAQVAEIKAGQHVMGIDTTVTNNHKHGVMFN